MNGDPPTVAKYAISQAAVPDGSSEYEVRSFVGGENCSFGEVDTDLVLRGSSDFRWHDGYNGASTGTGYVVRYASPPGCSASAYLSVRKIVNGTETTLALQTVPVQSAGSAFRASIRNAGTYPGIFVRLGTDTELFVPDTAISAGQPGIGSYNNQFVFGQRQEATIPASDLGPLDRVAPAAVPSGSVTVNAFVDYITLGWPAQSDDANGVGVLRYDLYKNGVFQQSTKQLNFTFLGLTPNTAYNLGIVTVDAHLNTSTTTTLSVTTMAAGSSTLDGRRTGIHRFASGWGAMGETIDTLSGNLNYTIPIASAPVRAGGAVALALTYNSQNWRSDNGTVKRLGGDIGFGWGWRMQAGSLTPVWQNANTFLYWLFTDSSGAEYRLDTLTNGKWTAKDGFYGTYDPTTATLWFNDGTRWLMSCESAATEQDAGTRYPVYLINTNGNTAVIHYNAGIGQPGGPYGYSSARVSSVGYAGGTITFTYNTDAVPHLISTAGYPGTATLTYHAASALTDPFVGGSYGTAVRLASHTVTNTQLTTSFTYNGSGELTKTVMPYAGELQWDHGTFTYQNNIKHREVTSRRLVKQAGAAAVSYNLTRPGGDASQPMHTALTLTDTGSGAVKDWAFSSAANYTRGFVTQYDERGSAGGNVLRRTAYTYTQDANSMPYVQSSTVTIDVGLGTQQVAKTDQTVDVYGNVTQSRAYAFNNTSNPIRTVNCVYLAPPGSTYIRNRVTSCSVTNGSQTFPLGSVSYDTTAPAATGVADTAAMRWAGYGPSYTTRGNPTVSNAPGGAVSTVTYNDLGEAVQAVTGSQSVAYVYAAGQNYMVPTTITPNSDANKQVSVGYNSWYEPTSQTAANGSWTTTGYDTAGRPNTRSNADGNSVTISYNDAARQVTETVGQRWVRSTADGLGRPVKVETGDSGGTKTIVESQYEPCACSPIGKLKKQSLPYAPGGTVLWVTYVYDGLGRTTQVQQPSGAGNASTSYSGNKVTVTDPAGRWKTQAYNSLGQLVQVTEPNPAGGASYETYYTYTLLGKLAQVNMPRPTGTQNRTFTYDSTWGVLLASETHPENGTTTYGYLSDGRLWWRQDAKSQRTYMNYDSYWRVASITRTDSGGTNQPCEAITYGYDSTQQEQGRLSTVTWGDANTAICAKGLHQESFDYTAMGRLTKKQMAVTQGSLAGTLAIQYAYDAEGKLTQVTYPATVNAQGGLVGGTVYAYQYDTMGRPTGETYQLNGAGATLPLVDSVVYDGIGQLTQMRFLRNGQMYTENRGYNSLLQMTSLTVKDASNAFVLNQEYRFSATANDGKLTSSKNNVTGEEVGYTYDPLGRLATATTVGPQWGLSWTFDGFGNRLQQNVTKGTAPPHSVLVDPATNRIQSWSYDANGNATFVPGVGTLAYDVADRVKTAGGETYWYDAGNKRIWKNSEFTFWAGSRIGRYTLSAYGFVRVATDEYFGGRRLQVLDRLGSNRESGKEYFPYGEERTVTANPADKFGTYERDATGLDYSDQRFFSASAGRFITSDPAKDGGNHFAYVDGDPVNRSDPSGLAVIVSGATEPGPIVISGIEYSCGAATGMRGSPFTCAPINGGGTRTDSPMLTGYAAPQFPACWDFLLGQCPVTASSTHSGEPPQQRGSICFVAGTCQYGIPNGGGTTLVYNQNVSTLISGPPYGNTEIGAAMNRWANAINTQFVNAYMQGQSVDTQQNVMDPANDPTYTFLMGALSDSGANSMYYGLAGAASLYGSGLSYGYSYLNYTITGMKVGLDASPGFLPSTSAVPGGVAPYWLLYFPSLGWSSPYTTQTFAASGTLVTGGSSAVVYVAPPTPWWLPR